MAQVPDFVSLNGPDNAGKTTHLVRLAGRWDGFQPLGAVHEHDPEPWSRVATDDYAQWWFETSTTVELTEMLLVGHVKRAAAREAGRTGLLDRGLPMLLAVATATCVVKDGLTVGEAFKTITGIAGSRATAPETAILLLPSLDTERNALAERADEVLGSLADAGRADAPLHTETLASVVDRLSVLTLRIWHSERAAARDELALRRVPALHGQREELCAALDALGSDVVAGRRRLPVPARFKLYGRDDAAPTEVKPSRHLRRVLAFGGLSECGKSTSAEFVQRTCGAQRLKIGFLLRQAAHREGLADPYALSAVGRPSCCSAS